MKGFMYKAKNSKKVSKETRERYQRISDFRTSIGLQPGQLLTSDRGLADILDVSPNGKKILLGFLASAKPPEWIYAYKIEAKFGAASKDQMIGEIAL
jgi:hypothetical protein